MIGAVHNLSPYVLFVSNFGTKWFLAESRVRAQAVCEHLERWRNPTWLRIGHLVYSTTMMAFISKGVRST